MFKKNKWKEHEYIKVMLITILMCEQSVNNSEQLASHEYGKTYL